MIGARRYHYDARATAGQQFAFDYDNIGNRRRAWHGGDTNGSNLRTIGYAVNNLNQYTRITNSGQLNVLGAALATNAVWVNGQLAQRQGEYFRAELALGNGNGPAWTNVAVASGGRTNGGGVLVPPLEQELVYDADGNLAFDGIWSYQWDGENRLVAMTMTDVSGISDAQRKRLEFAYDHLNRRVAKVVWTWNGSAFTNPVTNRYVYDGWNVLAVLDAQSSILQSFVWGQDLSGTLDGAGGVGGLLTLCIYSNSQPQASSFCAYDGNGNITALINAADKSVAARYEYSPYGELLRATGPLAAANPFRWSTKFWDEESRLVYYGYRYYSAALGRWISRDPVEEEGGINLYGFVANHPAMSFDENGLAEHHVATMALANSLPPGPGTDYFKQFKVPVADPHYYTREHRAYNQAVREAFEKWCNLNNIAPDHVAKSRALAERFVQDVMSQPRNSTIGAYLSKNMTFNGGKALKGAVVLGAAASGVFLVHSVYAGGNDLVRATQEYKQNVARGADTAWLDLHAVNVAVATQTMTGDYFVTMHVLGILLQ